LFSYARRFTRLTTLCRQRKFNTLPAVPRVAFTHGLSSGFLISSPGSVHVLSITGLLEELSELSDDDESVTKNNCSPVTQTRIT